MRGLWILTAMLAACQPVAATADQRDALEADKNWDVIRPPGPPKVLGLQA